MFHEEWSLDGGMDSIASNNSIELYNLIEDIGEANNLANEATEKRDELLNDLLNWQKGIGAPIPSKPNPDFEINIF